jgi:predicted DNA-binding protein
MPTQNFSATIEKKLLSQLDLLAQKTEKNRSWLIGKAVESYLEELEDVKIAKKRLKEPRLTRMQLKALLKKSK